MKKHPIKKTKPKPISAGGGGGGWGGPQMTNEEQIHHVLKDLLFAVTPSDVILASHGIVYVNGEALTPTQLQNLQGEVELIRKTNLYKILFGTPKDVAMKIMFEKAQSFDDMRAGKMLLYALDLQQKVMETIMRGKPL